MDDNWIAAGDGGLFVLANLGYAELPWHLNGLIALWLWCLGANVGSFMNVVVFRLPAGKSVVTPRSRCPGCGGPIQWYDNIPVLSWFWLKARCRRCGVPISSRYPAIEALVAALFVVMAFLGPITSGRHLPESLIVPPLRLQLMWTLWLMYAFHMLLLCTLICAALISYDRRPIPRRLFAPALVVGLAAPLVWPHLRPLAFAAPVHLADRAIALLDGLAGISVGAALAMARAVCWREPSGERREPWPVILAGAAAGLFLGWQAAAGIVVIAEMSHLVARRISHARASLGRIPWIGHLTLVASGYIVGWRAIHDNTGLLGNQATIATFAVAFLAVGLLAWLSAALALPAESARAEPVAPSPGARHMPSENDSALNSIIHSPSYRLAERDTEFLARPELRPIRLQLELLKPEMILTEEGVHSTIVAFGGTRIVEKQEAEQRLESARQALAETPDDPRRGRDVQRAESILAKSKYYDAAREFGRIVSSRCQLQGHCDFVIVTGGGPGIMEAANRGARDVGAKSIGLNITLPEEQAPNSYITPELCFQFHYFALRKMHFLLRAKALVVFPGGFGTLDELFDALTLRQTNRMQPIPIILFGKDYWNRVLDFQFLADEGTIRDEHLDLIDYADTPLEGWRIIADAYNLHAEPETGETEGGREE